MWVKILLLFFAFSIFFKTDTAFDQDLGRHIKLGEIIWQTKEVPKTNLFSYTNPDFPFINTHWLFEVIAFGFSQTIGLQVFLILKIVIILLSVWMTLKIIPKDKQALLLPVGFIFLHVLRERTELRPEIFSFLFTASTYYILERFLRGPTRLIFLLPGVQLVWINTHIYFFVGLLLQVIFITHLTYQSLRSHSTSGKLKLLTIIFILSVLVSIINTNGIAGLLYPLNVTKNYGYTIVENQTLFFLERIKFYDPNFIFVKISSVIVGISLLISFIRRQFEIKNIFMALAGAGLALMHVRSFPYLVFLSLPAVLLSIGTVKKSVLTTIITTVFTLMLLYESFTYLSESPGLKLTENGKGALDFVINNNLQGKIFNNFDIGSYIIYRGYLPAGRQGPKYRVFVDGRPEGYPAEFFTNTYIPMQYDYNKFKQQENLWGFKTIIFSHTDQTPWGSAFLQSVVKDAEWKIVYIDDFILVLIKNELAKEKSLPTVDLSKLDPSQFKFENYTSYLKIGFFLLKTGNTDSGNKFLQKASEISPKLLF